EEHANLMISVWPKFYPTTKNYQELDAKGAMYRRNVELGTKDWVGPGYLNSFYDPYSAAGRKIYWQQIRENLGDLGIDAWWMDATEPDITSNTSIAERKLLMGPTALGPGAAFFNSYSLMTTSAVYQGSRESYPDKRVFILTRSMFAGEQRNAAAGWSGDVVARWSNLRDQISAGINFSLSGIPNWTTDIGGYALEAWYDRLRYRLLPYIYTLAANTYFHDGTIMRGLVMDFPDDAKVRDIDDEYMFGPAFLVAPVTEYEARSREVYLPAGSSWYDFYSGKHYDGGITIQAIAPLARMPLFVRAGAIVPVGPAIQYSDEKPDAPITLYVYTGANGNFSLYHDQGTTYDYEHGAYARVPLSYDEASGTLTIGKREGSYPGMPAQRRFDIRWISGPTPTATDLDAAPAQSVDYSGAIITVHKDKPVQ